MPEILTMTKKIAIEYRSDTRGFTLIELMVAVFLLTFGLLGLAALQGQALRATGMGGSTTVANKIVRDAADRMIRNAANVGAYNGMDTGTNARPNCPNIAPTPVCAQDFADWQNVITNLPQGVLQVVSVPGGNFETATVTVTWRDAMGNHTVALPVQVAQ